MSKDKDRALRAFQNARVRKQSKEPANDLFARPWRFISPDLLRAPKSSVGRSYRKFPVISTH
jgi:hypothetical protein